MVGWLIGRLLAPFRLRTRRAGRGVFTFWDGRGWRSIDAIEAWLSITREMGEGFEDAIRAVTDTAPPGLIGDAARQFAEAKLVAAKTLADAVTRAFGVEPHRGDAGLSIPDRVALAAGFIRYMQSLRAHSRPS